MTNIYQNIRKLWKQPKKNLGDAYKERIMAYRREPAILRLERPSRIDRARALGYRAKQGFLIVRVRVMRGGRMNELPSGGRRTAARSRRKDLNMNYRQVAEVRAQDRYRTLEVLSSYYAGKDGRHAWYEVILIDPQHPVIKADRRISWITKSQNRGRVYRGLTSAAKKARGLRNKGKGAEKVRPSKAAVYRRKTKHQRKVKNL